MLEDEKNSLLLRIFESISLQNRSSPGNKNCNISPSHVRVPMSYVPNVPIPSVGISKDITHQSREENDKDSDEESRIHIRASSIPRPRAVLSSPDNDGLIGSRNRLSRDRYPISRAHISAQNRPVRENHVLKTVNKDSPVSARRVSKEKIHPKEKCTSQPTAPEQKQSIRKGKSNTGGL